LRARLYTIPIAGGSRFDGAPVSGELELDAAIVGRKAAAFRITGWLEMVDVGPDGERDTADDTALEIEMTLESIPTPEELSGQPAPPPRQPQSGFCEVPWCWTDDGYYDGYSYGYGCGDAEVGYDTTSDGCEGDTLDDGSTGSGGSGGTGGTGGPGTSGGVIDDGTTGTGGPGIGDDVSSDDGCSGERDDSSSSSDAGCEGSDDGSSSDGCDGGDSGSSSDGCADSGGDGGGCSDSGGGGGCSDSGGSGCGSGCQGDTLQRDDGNGGGRPARRAGVDLVGFGLMLAAIGAWISNRRKR
jgi:hypothetical protein